MHHGQRQKRYIACTHRNSALASELVLQASQLHAGANTQTFEVAASVWEKTSGCSLNGSLNGTIPAGRTDQTPMIHKHGLCHQQGFAPFVEDRLPCAALLQKLLKTFAQTTCKHKRRKTDNVIDNGTTIRSAFT